MSELSILLVEDNEDDRFLAMRALRKLPFPIRIETAHNGAEALDRLFGTPECPPAPLPDVVLLDLQMPKISGKEVLARLRENAATKNLPIVILTASDHPEDMCHCRELRICGYQLKPVETGKIQEVFASMGLHSN